MYKIFGAFCDRGSCVYLFLFFIYLTTIFLFPNFKDLLGTRKKIDENTFGEYEFLKYNQVWTLAQVIQSELYVFFIY